MDTLIKFIVKDNTPISEEWLNQPNRAYQNLSGIDKATFLVQQAIMVNYLYRVYDNKPADDIIDYKNKCQNWWLPDLDAELDCAEGVEKEAINAAIRICTVLLERGADSLEAILNISEISVLIERETDAPIAADASFYISYIEFINKAPHAIVVANSNNSEVIERHAFNYATVSLPTFSYAGRIIRICYDAAFSHYNYNVSLGIGEVSLNGKSFAGMGKEIVNNASGNKSFNIESGIGKVSLNIKE